MSDCSWGARVTRCEVCGGAEKLLYTATRHGLSESWLNKRTFSGTARWCPECGRRLHGR